MSQPHESGQQQTLVDKAIQERPIPWSNELILAQSLISNTTSLSYANADRSIGGIPVTFPAQTKIDTANFNDYFPQHVLRIYRICNSIMDPKTMPQAWLSFLKEADQKRKEKGSNISLDLISSAFILSLTSERYKLLQLPDFELSKDAFIDPNDERKVREAINGVIEDTKLRQELKDIASTLVPDIASEDMDMNVVVEVLKQQGINPGDSVLLDLGCGVGKRTLQWQQATGIQTIGLDRGYKEQWYAPVWNGQKNEDVEFIKADFAENIPLPSNSIDAVVMENVTQHILEDSLAACITGVIRVLKPNTGLIFVGPQETNLVQEQWRMFKKELDPKTKGYHLIEYPIIREFVGRKRLT
jgi:ubiquinone/menaquinone biosynthesis C-methylase UbiE